MESLEHIITIHVQTEEAISLESPFGDSVIMIPFSGTASGPLFEGVIQRGGVDTQVISQDRKRHTLSARYIIKGKDYTGEDCMVYIENNGCFYEGNTTFLFRTYPRILTSSQALAALEQELLVAEGVAGEDGLKIHIYKVN